MRQIKAGWHIGSDRVTRHSSSRMLIPSSVMQLQFVHVQNMSGISIELDALMAFALLNMIRCWINFEIDPEHSLHNRTASKVSYVGVQTSFRWTEQTESSCWSSSKLISKVPEVSQSFLSNDYKQHVNLLVIALWKWQSSASKLQVLETLTSGCTESVMIRVILIWSKSFFSNRQMMQLCETNDIYRL